MTAIFMGGFMLALASLLASVRFAQKHWSWHPEIARKVVHVSMGLSCLVFPLAFSEIWMVWLLLTLSLSLLFIVRWTKNGRAMMGDALHSVERRSLGELWFALAVAIVFTLAQLEQQPVLFWVPVLILTFSDAAAALIGIRYGQVRFVTSDGKKSIEGSTAFAVSCFFLVAFPLAILTDASALSVLLVSVILALLIMLVEGASWDGIDNLFIPIGSFFLLRLYFAQPEFLLWIHLLVLTVLIASFIWFRRKTLLDGSGLLGVILMCFFFWVLGDVIWLIAPTLYFLFYNYFSWRRGQTERYIHDIKSVIAIGGVASLCLIGEQIWHSNLWLYASISAFSCQLALTGLARREHFTPHHSRLLNQFMGLVQGTVFINFPAALALYWLQWSNIGNWLLAATVGLVAALILFTQWQPNLDNLPRDDSRWFRQGMAGLCATGITIIGTVGIQLNVG